MESEIKDIPQSSPFIVQTGGAFEESIQFFIACKQAVLLESKSFLDAILDLIATYYVFNIAYPKSLSGILLFFQHFLFGLKDSQPLPQPLQKLTHSLNCVNV